MASWLRSTSLPPVACLELVAMDGASGRCDGGNRRGRRRYGVGSAVLFPAAGIGSDRVPKASSERSLPQPVGAAPVRLPERTGEPEKEE